MNSASTSRGRDQDRFPRVVVGLLACVLGSSQSAHGDEVFILSNKDNTLYEDAAGSLSNGAGVSMFVGRTNTGLLRRAVLSFDIAGNIPAGSTINSVSLTLQLTQTILPVQTIDMHRLTGDWGEGASNAFGGGGGGAPSAANDATWIHKFFNSVMWNNVGGDFSTLVSASQTTGDLGAYTWSSSQLQADVQSMLDSPGTNFGWILIGDEGTNGSADRFGTREHPIEAFRPSLFVTFTTIPEPGGFTLMSVALAVIGGLAFRLRRTLTIDRHRMALA
jgi:hypothetical protein